MNLIDEVKRLREMENIEKLGSVRDLLDILAGFQPGYANDLGFALSGEWQPKGCSCKGCQDTTATVHRFLELARKMEKDE